MAVTRADAREGTTLPGGSLRWLPAAAFLGPPAVWIGALFILPMATIVLLSFWRVADYEIIADFISETREGLEALDSELVQFEQDPENPSLLDNIFRLFHTIKGTCGFLGLTRLEGLAHAVLGLAAQVAELAAERRRDRGGDRREREHRREHGERGGEPVGDAAPLQPADDGEEQRAGEDGDDDRDHDHPEVDERVHHHGHRAGDRQEAPARGARRPVPARHRGVAVRPAVGGGRPCADRRTIVFHRGHRPGLPNGGRGNVPGRGLL